MITITITCAMCGEMLFSDDGTDEFEATRSDDKPHYNLDRDLKKIARRAKWIFQDAVCGDFYCSKTCAE